MQGQARKVQVEISRCERDTCKTFWFALECWTLGVALGIHACDFGACARAERRRERDMGAKGSVSGKGLRHTQHYDLSSSYFDLSQQVSNTCIRCLFLQYDHDDNWM